MSAFGNAVLLVPQESPIMEPIAKGPFFTSCSLVPDVPEQGRQCALHPVVL